MIDVWSVIPTESIQLDLNFLALNDMIYCYDKLGIYNFDIMSELLMLSVSHLHACTWIYNQGFVFIWVFLINSIDIYTHYIHCH